jgi:hypothetical protein
MQAGGVIVLSGNVLFNSCNIYSNIGRVNNGVRASHPSQPI